MHGSSKTLRRFAIGAFCFAWVGAICCAAQSPIAIPGPGDGYEISKSDSSQAAPSGYEGRTDTAVETAVGNTAATAGKRIVTKFTLGNQIRTCPHADGSTEGEGVFSMSVDYTNAQESGTTSMHIEMGTRGQYKGQVGDDALLHGPVDGQFDYTYTQTGKFRDKSGAITNSPPSNIEQHIAIPIVVMPNMNAPSFGAFSGGDPTVGHYSDAFSSGMALAYWAGVYFSIAQMKWYGGETGPGGQAVRAGQCVVVAFDPPSFTLQPPLGATADVKAVVKTKGGEIVNARVIEANAFNGSGITPTQGATSTSSPLKFVYTAPKQKVARAGFSLGALSRAGAAVGEWHTGLGTDWSGQITYEMSFTGDDGGSPGIQEWSYSSHVSVTVTVENGVASYRGHVDNKGHLKSWQPVAKSSPRIDYSDDSEEIGDGEFPASLSVQINEERGTYGISVGPSTTADGRPKAPWGPIGKSHTISCQRVYGCKTYDRDLGMPTIGLSGPLSGNLQDPNHIQASYTYQKTEQGRSHKGVHVETTTVNLARSGTTNRSGSSKKGGL
ncbi:hypothetical protein [Occallatibacter savannae]|uniref:hypothetical protein n=1 Tax=Occallatibacter savannae TaxID=1002691 RepID=UPI000D68E066|nr:hypothetical protein [Occallatibacter savannae]